MWSTLIGLIERWWREKPRLDVVRAVVNLRDSMIECQSWYSRYLNALKAGDLDILSPHPRVEWTRSLARLTVRVVELDTVLSIFTPEAHEAITSYLDAESLEAGALGLEVAAKELREPLDLDIRKVTMNASFDEALVHLREFIAKNFKPDEVFAVSQSRWR
jgi:hypothetical protein